MSFHILPECYADTKLIQLLGYPRVNHCHCIGEVANSMIKNYKNRLAIGIVDKDKPGTVPSYFNEFQLIEEFGGLEYKKHPDCKHYLFVLSPALEQWILDTSEDLSIDIESYGFRNLKSLMNATKSKNVGDNQKFSNLLNTIKQKKGSPLKKVKKLIDTLLENA